MKPHLILFALLLLCSPCYSADPEIVELSLKVTELERKVEILGALVKEEYRIIDEYRKALDGHIEDLESIKAEVGQ